MKMRINFTFFYLFLFFYYYVFVMKSYVTFFFVSLFSLVAIVL